MDGGIKGMVWGRARTLIGVHWFDEKGESLCKDRHGRHLKLRYPRPDWDPSLEDTCQTCKVLRQDEERIELVIIRLRAELKQEV